MFSLVSFLLSLGAVAEAAGTSFVLVGDSTTADGRSVDSGGWGNGFCGSAANGTPSALEPNTPCINTAKNGATTGSFVADGSWDVSISAVQQELSNGQAVYITLQFGHNDQKIASPESMGANLTEMANELLGLGAVPVLITSLTRRSFNSDGTVADTLGPWADETIAVGTALGTHVLDLHGASITYVEAIREDAAHRLNKSPDDNTHLNDDGAIVFGRMVADLMQESFDGTLPIIANEELSFNISHGIASF